MSKKTIPFVLCDVFTDRQFEGNQLAVITDASALTTQEMQHIATEFNFSESTFVLEGDNTASHHIRIFTPTHEVPFAGHPNVGTAHVLAAALPVSKLPLVFTFKEDAGLVAVTVSQTDRGIFCEIKAPESLSIGATVEPGEIAAALSMTAANIDVGVHTPLIASVGLPFILARVESRDVLSKAVIDITGFRKISNKYPCEDILIYWIDEDEVIHTRVFAPFDNVPEDPATGSANGALVALLSRADANKEDERSFRVHQGDDMGRPCRLFLRTVRKDQAAHEVFIGGYSKTVGTGNLLLESDSASFSAPL